MFNYQRTSLLWTGGEVEAVLLGMSAELLARALDVVDNSSPMVLMAEHSKILARASDVVDDSSPLVLMAEHS